MSERDELESRQRYRVFIPLATRWRDNDIFGHVNNVVYYSYIDTAVTTYYFERARYDVTDALVIPNAAETKCTYKRPIKHPASIEAGLRADRIGNTSAQIGVGIFLKGDDKASAWGYMVHVFVDRVTTRPVPIPAPLRAVLEQIAVEGQ
jgi:acyl-CoA thioester hydrolase